MTNKITNGIINKVNNVVMNTSGTTSTDSLLFQPNPKPSSNNNLIFNNNPIEQKQSFFNNNNINNNSLFLTQLDDLWEWKEIRKNPTTNKVFHYGIISTKSIKKNGFIIRNLLERVYNELLIPNFPIESELEPKEKWCDIVMSTKKEDIQISPKSFVLVVFEMKENYEKLVGSLVFEYFDISECALLTYVAIRNEFRGNGIFHYGLDDCYNFCKNNFYLKRKGIIWNLIQNVLKNIEIDVNSNLGQLHFIQQIMEIYLLQQNNLQQKKDEDNFYFFAETNAIDVFDGIMSSEKRHEIFKRSGFSVIDFDYIQPPLQIEDRQLFCDKLILLSLEKEDGNRTISSFTLKCFLLQFLYGVYDDVIPYMYDDYFQYMWNSLNSKDSFIISNDPSIWKRKTNFNRKRESKL
ncbi:hypothetical protein ABK040_000404 [Willaertia magna]